jgi:hypothetical protein
MSYPVSFARLHRTSNPPATTQVLQIGLISYYNVLAVADDGMGMQGFPQ